MWSGARQVSVGNYGQNVHEMLAAYHDPSSGGPTTGYVRLLEFNPDGKTVQVKTYSPILDQYMTDGNNQFVIETGVVSEPSVPLNSILVSTRDGAGGIVALDLDGTVVGGFVPRAPYDVVGVQQIAPNGDILLGMHPGGGDKVSRYSIYGNFVGDIGGTLTGNHTGHLAISDPLDGKNIAFVEYNGEAISRIDLTTNQVVATWDAGTGDTTFRGIDVGPDGCVYTAVINSGIWKFANDLSSHEVVAADPQSFADITFGPDGMLYASTYYDSGVRRYDVSAGTSETFIANGSGGLSLSTGLMFHPTTGNLLVGSYNTNQILEFDGATGAYVGVFAAVNQAWNISMAPAHVPEPGTIAMMLMGAGALAMWPSSWRP